MQLMHRMFQADFQQVTIGNKVETPILRLNKETRSWAFFDVAKVIGKQRYKFVCGI